MNAVAIPLLSPNRISLFPGTLHIIAVVGRGEKKNNFMLKHQYFLMPNVNKEIPSSDKNQ